MTTLGQRIRKLRTQKNMTQKELAKGMITANQLSIIENGASNPSLETLKFIANRLEVPLAALFVENFRTYKECTAFIDKCEGLLQAGQYTEVIKNIETFISDIGGADDFVYRDISGKMYCILGIAYFELKDEGAKGYGEKSLEYLSAEEFDPYYFKALNLLGMIEYEKGNYGDAQVYLRKAYEVMDILPCNYFSIKFKILYDLMLTHRTQGKLSEAIDYGEACVKHVADSQYFNVKSGQLYTTMSSMWEESGNYGEALKYSLKAVDIFSFREDKISMFDCFINIASLHRKMGAFYESIGYIAQADQYFEGEKTRKNWIAAKCEWVKTKFFISENTDIIIYSIKEIMYSEYLEPKDKAVLTAMVNLLQLPGQNAEKAIGGLLDCEKELAGYDDREFILYVYATLSKLYKRQGDIETAYDYLLKVNDANRHLYKEFDI